MELAFHTNEKDGAEGAKRKAWLLNRESGYNIVSIEHRSLPVANDPMEAQVRWGKSQLGYKITVETLPRLFSDFIPNIIEA